MKANTPYPSASRGDQADDPVDRPQGFDAHENAAALRPSTSSPPVDNPVERGKAEPALGESGERFRAFVTASSDVLYRMNADWSEMLHLEGRGFMADTLEPTAAWLEKYIHPEDQLLVTRTIDKAVKTKGVFELEHRVIRPDSTFGWTFSRAIPILDERGEIVEWFGVAADVTARKFAEEALREVDQRLRLATEAADIYSWEIDLAAGKLIWGPNAPVALGIPSEFLREEFSEAFELVHADDLAATIATVRAAIAANEDFEMEFRLVDPRTGDSVWVSSHAAAVRDGASQAVRYIGVSQNITRRKRSENKLAAAAAHDEYRVRPNDAVRPLREAEDVKKVAVTILAEHLGANRAFYAEVHGNQWLVSKGFELGVPPLVEGLYPAESFGAWFLDKYRAGERVVSRDTRTDPRFSAGDRAAHAAIGIVGGAGVPLLKAGELVAILAVNTASPRDWTEEEIALIEETAERTWDAVERVRAEEGVRASERRLRFLDDLGEATRAADEPTAVMAAATRLVGKHLQVTRCAYADVDADNDRFTIRDDWRAPGASTTAGVYSLESFGPRAAADMRAGRLLVVRDVDTELAAGDGADTFNAIGIKAIICCPLVKDGRLRAMMAVHNASPRNWTSEDVTLVREAAERSWAHIERVASAEAVRESEERLRKAISIETVGVLFFSLGGRIHSANAALERMCGYTHEELSSIPDWSSLTPPEFMGATQRAAEEVASCDITAPYEKQWIRKDGSRFWGMFAPTRLSGEGKDSECVEFIIDITDRKRAEAELQGAHAELEMRVQERTRDLAEANDTLAAEVEERKALEQVRVELIRRIVTTQEEERRRMSRDLHDQLGQQMTALRLKLSALRDLTGDEGDVASHVRSLQGIADSLDSEISFLSSQMRPTSLDDLGLEEALKAYAIDWSQHFGIPVDFHSSLGSGERVSDEMETHLYRITQEALNNVAKHAAATRVGLLLKKPVDGVVLVVEDNGVGFDPRSAEPSKPGHGLGLVGMRERAKLIGADVEVESKPGSGTTVYVRVDSSVS